jgi:hypothetical protein
MAVRLTTFVPKAVLIGLVAVLCLAAATYAAEQTLVAPPAAPAAVPVQQMTLVVPDVRRQAFVFAKGALGDAGFAWRVAGSVHGYSANVVSAQSPEPGTKVIDTGSPVVTVTLAKNSKYAQEGTPADISSYRGTAIRLADAAVAPVPAPATPVAPTPAAPPPAAPTAPAKSKAPAAKVPAAKLPLKRPAAFHVAGATKEPLDEIPLPERARQLDAFIAAHPHPRPADVQHFLYQNEWIVTGARFGWWRGAEALQTLAVADRHAQAAWRIGAKSESLARAALTEVKASAR